MGEIKKIVISPNASEGAEKLENSYIASGNAEWKCIWQLIRKLNICIPYDPAMALLKKKKHFGKNWTIYPREVKLMFTEKPVHNFL